MRRVVFYMFYDEHGVVDDYVLVKLQALREHADHIYVISNSAISDEGLQRLNQVADTVRTRENVGFDVWAYKEALEAFGTQRLAEYDELILTNYTYFGPIYPFAETFTRFDERADLDFWGLTEHKRLAENPLAAEGETGPLEAHIQSHWIAVRKTMFTSIEFAQYWQQMPMISSYLDSIRHHEARFTKHFADHGFRYAVAFPAANYPSDNPVFVSISLMLDDRCPIVKRRLFFHDPLYMDRTAVLGKRVLDKIDKAGYPLDLIWRSVGRTTEPRVLYTNAAMLSVLPDLDTIAPARTQRICVLAHIYYDDMVDELMSAIGNIPVPYDVVVTTDTAAKQEVISRALTNYDINKVDVRVVESNNGRSESAFLITCRDVLTSGSYDLILKVHSKKSPQDAFNNGQVFKDHTIENLLSSPGYVAHLLQLFAQDPQLGMVFPPLIHIGFPTMGHSWFANYEPAVELAQKLAIRTKFDPSTPLSANGGMFWARPEALAKLAQHPFEFADFVPGDEGWRDGQLPHVLERLYGYAVVDAGYTLRAVANAEWAAVDYTLLEYKLQRISSMLPAFTEDQIAYVGELQRIAQEHRDEVPARPWSAFIESMNVHHPRFVTAAMVRSAQHGKTPGSAGRPI